MVDTSEMRKIRRKIRARRCQNLVSLVEEARRHSRHIFDRAQNSEWNDISKVSRYSKCANNWNQKRSSSARTNDPHSRYFKYCSRAVSLKLCLRLSHIIIILFFFFFFRNEIWKSNARLNDSVRLPLLEWTSVVSSPNYLPQLDAIVAQLRLPVSDRN